MLPMLQYMSPATLGMPHPGGIHTCRQLEPRLCWAQVWVARRGEPPPTRGGKPLLSQLCILAAAEWQHHCDPPLRGREGGHAGGSLHVITVPAGCSAVFQIIK
jgi:hypothetical protein